MMEELQAQINDLQRQIDALKASTTIPFEVAVAIKDRLSQDFVEGDPSVVLASTYTQTVNEAGSATYNVAKPMTGFIDITFNGVTYTIAHY